MLLIWGFRVRHRTLEDGHFHCLHEGADRPYQLKEARRWFTLFFIPLIPLKVLGTVVACGSCGKMYEPRVLAMATNAQMQERLAQATRRALAAVLQAGDAASAPARAAAGAAWAASGFAPDAGQEFVDELARVDLVGFDHDLVAVAGSLTPAGQEQLLRACVSVAAADGALATGEIDVLRQIGAALGMSPAHIRGVLAEVQDRESDLG